MTFAIRLELVSGGTFGRGDGVVGLIDVEVEHDSDGLPYLSGRALKGLLVEECANLLYPLESARSPAAARLGAAAGWLFGRAGALGDGDAAMHVGPAVVPEPLGAAVRADVAAGRLTPIDVLESLTAIRRQTGVDQATGAPRRGTLRSTRVVLRETPFVAQLAFDAPPAGDALALLAGCVAALRRAGVARSRGRGRLRARLLEDGRDVTDEHVDQLAGLVGATVGGVP